MRLTHFSDYSLRTLIYANLNSHRLCQSKEVALSFGISKTHIFKCVHQLGQWKFIESVQGRHGGFRLARDADDISVGAVIRKTEDTFNLVECFNAKTNTCPLTGKCKLQKALMRAMASFMAEMDRISIADITTNKDDLFNLLKT